MPRCKKYWKWYSKYKQVDFLNLSIKCSYVFLLFLNHQKRKLVKGSKKTKYTHDEVTQVDYIDTGAFLDWNSSKEYSAGVQIVAIQAHPVRLF